MMYRIKTGKNATKSDDAEVSKDICLEGNVEDNPFRCNEDVLKKLQLKDPQNHALDAIWSFMPQRQKGILVCSFASWIQKKSLVKVKCVGRRKLVMWRNDHYEWLSIKGAQIGEEQ